MNFLGHLIFHSSLRLTEKSFLPHPGVIVGRLEPDQAWTKYFPPDNDVNKSSIRGNV